MWENQEWQRRNGGDNKDTMGVQTSGLAEMLQEMMEVRSPRWGGAEAETHMPSMDGSAIHSSPCGLWHSEDEVPWLCTGRCYSRDEHSPQKRG